MKTKITVSLTDDLVDQLDEEADREEMARSQMVERILTVWFELKAKRKRQKQLDEATIAYYDGLTQEQVEEHAALSRAAGRAARGLKYDG